MNERFPQHFFMGMVVLALGMVAIGWFTSSSIKAAKRANDTITVTGSARESVRSDYVVWTGSVRVSAMTREAGYPDLTKQSDRIRAYLKSRHLPDSSITWSGVRSNEIHEGKRSREGEYIQEFKGYSMWQQFEVRSAQVDSIDAIARDITSLIGEGVPLDSDPPQFYYNQLSDIRGDLLAEATKDAKMRAQRIAESAGGKVRSVRSARMGVFQITPPNSREVSDYGVYDTRTIDKDITAVVSVSFAVE
jgi:hypothetical protein